MDDLSRLHHQLPSLVESFSDPTDASNSSISSIAANKPNLQANLTLLEHALSQHFNTAIPLKPRQIPLLCLPPEIRTMVLEYLLLSSALADEKCHKISTKYGADVKYGLSPAIIETCRTLYFEGIPILYHRNTFVVVQQTPVKGWDDPNLFIHPVTRFLNQDLTKPPHPDYLAGTRNIRNWRIVSGAYLGQSNIRAYDSPDDPQLQNLSPVNYHVLYSPSFMNLFVRMISKNTTNSLYFLLLPPTTEFEIFGKRINMKAHASAFQELLVVLDTIRNVKSVKLRSPKVDGHRIGEKLRSQLIALEQRMGSNDPVELVSDLREKLCKYVVPFERCKVLQIELRGDHHLQLDPERMGEEYAKFRSRKAMNPPMAVNPFRPQGHSYHLFPIHPVEQDMSNTLAEQRRQNIKGFKFLRNRILVYLEPQYQRMTTAMHSVGLIKPLLEGIIHDPLSLQYLQPAEVYEMTNPIHLEEAMFAFQRDMPWLFRHIITHNDDMYNGYLKQEREHSLENLQDAYADGDLVNFARHALEIIEDMRKQYFEIYEARKEVFSRDLSDRGSTLALEVETEGWFIPTVPT